MNTDHEIARIAYELYLKRGSSAGDPVADWMAAERIYLERLQASASAAVAVVAAKSIELRETPATVEPKSKPAKVVVATEPKTATRTVKAATPKQPVDAKPAPLKATPKAEGTPAPKKTTKKS